MVNVYVSAGLEVPSNGCTRDIGFKTMVIKTAKNVGRNTTYEAFRADLEANYFLYECYATLAGK